MMAGAFLLLQAAAPPDIELRARVVARELRVASQGEARLEVRAEPDGGSSVEASRHPDVREQTRLRNVTLNLHAGARIADPGQVREQQEPDTSEPR
jgi:hypothetical protein